MSETLSISPKRKAFYDALWDRWPIVLLIVFDLTQARRGPVSTAAIAVQTRIHDLKSVRGYLRDLDQRGYIAQPYEGKWLMTDLGVMACERVKGYLVSEPAAELAAEGKNPQLGGKTPNRN